MQQLHIIIINSSHTHTIKIKWNWCRHKKIQFADSKKHESCRSWISRHCMFTKIIPYNRNREIYWKFSRKKANSFTHVYSKKNIAIIIWELIFVQFSEFFSFKHFASEQKSKNICASPKFIYLFFAHNGCEEKHVRDRGEGINWVCCCT